MAGSQHSERGLSRRAVLGGLGAAGVASSVAGIPLVSSALAAPRARSAAPAAPAASTALGPGTHLVLLGVRGGPTFGTSTQTSTAVAVNGRGVPR